MAIERCTECQKVFIPAPEHLYKVPGLGKQCSYSCWNKAKARTESSRPRASNRREKG